MLRVFFNEGRRMDGGLLAEVNAALQEYEKVLRGIERKGHEPDPWRRYLQVWAKGFLRSMDELEQSIYCARQFSRRIRSHNLEDMKPGELDDYHRHVYFYKNAIIRMFSILDKTGCFLNALLKLETEKVKGKFSYFTVLRQMHERKIAVDLEKQLYGLKEKYRAPMQRLRAQRNTEIHGMNEELVDDVERLNQDDDGVTPLESIKNNMDDLDEGFKMICHTVINVFSSLRENS